MAAKQQQLALDGGQHSGPLGDHPLELEQVLADGDALDGLGVDVAEVVADLSGRAEVARDVGDEDRAQVRLLGQQIAVAQAGVGVVLDEELPHHDERQEVRREAVDPQAVGAGADVGHGEAHEVREEQAVDVALEVVGLGAPPSREVEGEEEEEGEDGHLDAAAQGQAVEAEEDDGVEAHALDDLVRK